MVRQESYEWSEAGFNDFIGIEYTITNIGTEVLEGVYVGFFADPDIGVRTTPNYYEDDAVGSFEGLLCTMYGGAPLDFAYAYDADGDGGQVTSYIGYTFLGHPTDPAGVLAPAAVGIASYHSFFGNQSYEEGGDPTNDFERYEVMSNLTRDRDFATPRDYRQLISAGPFASLAPGESFTVQVALVAGNGLLGLRDNMAAARLTYDGAWYNLDGNPLTGIAGRETPVFGPAQGVVIDPCQGTPPIDVPAGAVVWVNADCAAEEFLRAACGYTEADSVLYMTGVGGREYNVHWILPPQNPVPVFVTGFDAAAVATRVTLAWDIYSEEDVSGFRIYRQTGEQERLELLNTGGLIAPESRSYTDASVRAGETYSYMLGVVLADLMDNSEVVSPVARVTLASAALRLDQNHPNPFNPRTTISFSVPDRARVRLAVYSADGRLVRTLVDGAVPGGFNEVSWDGMDGNGSPVSSGVYFYRLETGKRMLARKMVYLK
ncbi:MAG: FlgD immunoglobulin-like domain containing protein [bacterium]